MSTIVEYLAEERLQLGLVTTANSQRLTVRDARGRTSRVAPDKVLFRHGAAHSLEDLQERLDRLRREVDVALLWESLREGEGGTAKSAVDLARIFFDRDDSLHGSAIFRALSADKLHFRRRGTRFTPRSGEEVAQIREMRDAERRTVEEIEALKELLSKGRIDRALGQRVERWLRGSTDRELQSALESLGAHPEQRAFDLLLRCALLPATADLAVLRANLRAEHSAKVVEHAARLQVAPQGQEILAASFAIDDADTREVDDALSAEAEGSLLRVDIDIADVTAFVSAGDPVDREALKRATTVYLPTDRFFMLPESLACDRASLLPGKPRPALRMSIYFDESGEIARHELKRRWIRVERRLRYEEADQLMHAGSDEAARTLRLLGRVAEKRRDCRRRQGALLLQRQEWKVRVDEGGGKVTVRRIDMGSASRLLVAELMILANELGARYAVSRNLPFIFRGQVPPANPLPPIDPSDPTALLKLRGLIKAAALSTDPQPHWGLGLDLYAQVSSPLRRYGDLVLQRQLVAELEGQPVVHGKDDLQQIAATLENTEQEIRRVEAAATQRWMLEAVARQPLQTNLHARVVAAIGGGFKVQLADWGANGLLPAREGSLEVGSEIRVDIEQVRARKGLMRLVLSREIDQEPGA